MSGQGLEKERVALPSETRLTGTRELMVLVSLGTDWGEAVVSNVPPRAKYF